ncbi:hypothetical protein BDR04DRAFT_1109918 [Suillus decipiens]|nr:hypothetical protein BDR04DRAFT_1109918 [Suillus decipiens]
MCINFVAALAVHCRLRLVSDRNERVDIKERSVVTKENDSSLPASYGTIAVII